jgi:predicted solute-binding protein
MKAEAGELPFDVDLGDWWQKTFHHPFVYAVWALRSGNPELQEILQDSFLAGQKAMDTICEEAALSMGLPLQEVRDYLGERIHFELDLPRLEGLRLFHRLCQEDHLAPLRASVSAMLENLGAAPRAVAAPAL